MSTLEPSAPVPEVGAPRETAPEPAAPSAAAPSAAAPSAAAPSAVVAPERSRRRRVILIAFALVAASFLVAIVVFAIRLYPWIRMPDEPRKAIEARWKRVEVVAEVRDPNADDTMLVDSIKAFRGVSPPPNDARTIQRSALTEQQSQAITELMRWHARGSPFRARLCGDPSSGLDAIAAFRLGQTALLTASGGEDIAVVEAVLALAAHERRKGHLIELSAGSDLAVRVAEWSRDHKVPLPSRFVGYRPSVEEIRRAVAREAVCVLSLLGPPGRFPFTFAASPPGPKTHERPPLGLVRLERDRLVFEQYQGKLYETAYGARNDWKRVAEIYERAATEHPKSVVIDLAVPAASVVRKACENYARYNELSPMPPPVRVPRLTPGMQR
jgi:hypothetical protein